MKKLNKYLPITIAFFLSMSCANYAAQKGKNENNEDKQVAQKATVLVPQLLRYHFNPRTPNQDLSKELYEEFFKALDPQKSFFLQKDIEILRKYQSLLISQMTKGDYTFPIAISQIYKARLKNRVEYVRERMEKPLDTNGNETFLLDRKDEKWCTTEEELNQLWEKRLINAYINYELVNESLAKDNANKKASKEMQKLQKTPKERILSFYNRLLTDAEQETDLDVVSVFLSCYSHLFDPHSDYMNPETMEDFEIQMNNSLMGIGATLQQEEQFIKITDMVLGGPAAKDGRLKKGDYIIAVRQDGEEETVDLIDMPLRKAIKFIRGKKDTVVFLTVMQPGEPSRIIDIRRDEIIIEEGKAKISFKEIPLPNDSKSTIKVGHLDLPAFYYECAPDVKKCIETANKEKADAIILDLRMNGGGSLQDCVKIAGYFFDKGPVVQSKNHRNGRYEIIKMEDPDDDTLFNGPLVVLTDDFSASASEIVSACLQDCSRAIILGTPKTHGKGSVQNVIELKKAISALPSFFGNDPDLGAQKLTIAKFYRINGGSTQIKGVTPDITYKAFSSATASYEGDLPHALAWDEIEPAGYKTYLPIKEWLPSLRERSNSRVAANKEFQEMLQNIEQLQTLNNQKTVTLNKAERQAQQAKVKELTKKIFLPRLSDKRKDDAAEADTPPPKDLLLDEAYAVIADLFNCYKQQQINK